MNTGRTLLAMLLLLVCVTNRSHAQRYAFVTYPKQHQQKIVGGYSEHTLAQARLLYNMQKMDVTHLLDSQYQVNINCDKGYNLGLIIEQQRSGKNLVDVLKGIRFSSALMTNDKSLDAYLDKISKSIDTEKDSFVIIDVDTLVSTVFFQNAQTRSALFGENQRRRVEFCQLTKSYGLSMEVPLTDGSKFVFKIFSSDEDFPINEPRQYVTIYEKTDDLREASPIWWLEKNIEELKRGIVTDGSQKFSTFQKYRVISKNSLLEIKFDQEAIAKNINFLGSISLSARSGANKVEVAPYFVIGQEQKAFGVSAMPIKEIADYFLRLMIEADNYNETSTRLQQEIAILTKASNAKKNTTAFEAEKKDVLASAVLEAKEQVDAIQADLGRLKDLTKEIVPDERLFNKIQKLNYFIRDAELSLIAGQASPIEPANYQKKFTYGELDTTLMELEPQIEKQIGTTLSDPYHYYALTGRTKVESENAGPKASDVNLRNLFTGELDNLKLLYELLRRIKESNNQTINAFLSFTILTITDFEDIYKRTEAAIMKIEKEKLNDFSASKVDSAHQRALLDIFNQVNPAFQSFFNSSVLFNQLMRAQGYAPSSKIDTATSVRRMKSLSQLTNDASAYNYIRDKFALAAGKEIFKRLVYASIDVSKANIKDGEELVISVVWYNSDGNKNGSTNNTEDAVELATARFIVKEVGWHVEVTESAFLIHRIDEEKLRPDYPLSPSNFKPTGGASLMWTYYNPHRTAERKKQDHWLVKDKNVGKTKQYGFVKFLHWLEPSFGINVSYTDFRTDRDIEFGAGPVIGFFRNSIFFTTGYAFNVNGESPFYMGIGFSFSNIFQHVNKSQK